MASQARLEAHKRFHQRTTDARAGGFSRPVEGDYKGVQVLAEDELP